MKKQNTFARAMAGYILATAAADAGISAEALLESVGFTPDEIKAARMAAEANREQ